MFSFAIRKLTIISVLCIHFQIIKALTVPIDSYTKSSPIPPSKDPFYQPPQGYESTSPGTVLRSRPVPNPLAAFSRAKIKVKGAYQFLYRSADTHGNAEAAVTTLIVPYNADPTKLLSYQVFEDSAFVDCAPSVAFQYKTKGETIASQAEVLFITAALNRGWYVNSPDYEGPKAAFTAGVQAGQATIDSIRAVLSTTALTNLSSNATIGLWGFSGGSLATGWAAQLQPTYAPELNFAGAALGSTIPDIRSVLYRINNGPWVGLAPAGIMGLVAEYPELGELVDQHLIPDKAKDFKRTLSTCILGNVLDFVGQNMFKYIDDPGILDAPLPTEVMYNNTMGHAPPKAPLYIYKSIKDELSVVYDTDLLVSNWCSEGVPIEYLRDKDSEHIILLITGAAGALLWLDDRFGGKPANSGCSVTNVTSSLTTPGALKAFGSFILNDLKDLAGKKVGPLSIT
jgi:Secretory lipase